MRSIGTRDLFALAILVSLHFTICKLAVDFRGSRSIGFTLLTPIALTGLLQVRFNLSWQVATAIHYPLSLVWAFLHGATYSMIWNRVPHEFFERDSVGLDTPIRYGLFCTEIWLFVGIFSTTVYGFFARLFATRTARLASTSTTDEPIDEPKTSS